MTLTVRDETASGAVTHELMLEGLAESVTVRELIRSRYLIAYKAADFEPNGKYRTVHITAEKSGHRMQVHARKGYFARVESPQQK